MADVRSCRLCGFDGLEAAVSLRGMPRWNHRLLRDHELASDRGIELTVYRCPSCGFMSLPSQLGGDYYDDYVNAPSLSPQAQQFQTEQAQAFVQRFGLIGRRVLEIGCGDGFFLQALVKAGAEGYGIEPSSAHCKIAKERGLRVETATLSDNRILAAAPFDAFVTRQVFEHVEDMRDFLLSIRANLTEAAAGLIEVPNLEKLVEESRFFDLIPEHLNYFTPRSLSLALQLAGFEVLDICPVQEGESLRALVSWQPLPSYHNISERIQSLREDIEGYLQTTKSEGKKVALWGAGGKGLSMLAAADLKQVQLLVDTDPGKQGLYTPVSHLQVQLPREIARQAIDAVIIIAPAYEIEIARTLRDELAFKGQIMLAGSSLTPFEEVSEQP